MKRLIMVNKLLSILAFIGTVATLLYKGNFTLIASAILIAMCVIITFIISTKVNNYTSMKE